MEKKLLNIFNKYDVDKSGCLSVDELSSALAELGTKVSLSEITQILKNNDTNNDGTLDFTEFKLIFNEAKLLSTFNKFDEDGSGEISLFEVQNVLQSLGYNNLSLNDVEELVKKVDTDGSGLISYIEFKEFFKFVPGANLENIAKFLVNTSICDVGTDIAPPIPAPNVPWYYSIFGGLGGILSRTLTAPLERIKIKAQTQSLSSGRIKIISELNNTVKEFGWRGLFAGNAANCLRVFPMAGTVTYTYLNLLTVTPADNELDFMEPVYRGACAALAGCVGQTLTYPIDTIRTRITISPEIYNNSIIECFKQTLQKEGGRGLYKGMIPTLFCICPFLAIQMSTADALKSIWATNNWPLTTTTMFCFATTSAILAQSVVYPLDVLRRRQQVTGSATANVTVMSDSTWMALRNAVQTRTGFSSLFVGIVPTYLKVLPSVAIAMTTTKELIGLSKKYIDK